MQAVISRIVEILFKHNNCLWLEQFIEKVVFATRDAHQYKNTMLQKKCHTWFWWYHCKACVFILTDETTWLGFPDLFKRQNNYIIFLFIRSGLYICRNCTFIAFVISRETRLTPFSLVWSFSFQHLQSSHLAYVNDIIPISIQRI